jgi:ribose 5-phosphate isomerase B
MKVAIASDHAGFNELKQIKEFLEADGHEVTDFGPKSLNPNDDYPDFIFPAARAVANKTCDVGIILGGSGQGEAMAANRVKGVRCAVFYGAEAPKKAIDVSGRTSDDAYEILKLSRQHNLANMLSLAARFLTEEQVKQAVEVWLNTPLGVEERHIRRIMELDQ